MVRLLLEGALEAGEDAAPDLATGLAVVVPIVFIGFCGPRSARLWCRGQRKDLESRAVIGNEVPLDEGIASVDIVVEGHLEEGAERVVVVEAHPTAITGENEKHIKPQLVGRKGREEAFSQETIRQKREALVVDASDPLWTEGVSNHRVLGPFTRAH